MSKLSWSRNGFYDEESSLHSSFLFYLQSTSTWSSTGEERRKDKGGLVMETCEKGKNWERDSSPAAIAVGDGVAVRGEEDGSGATGFLWWFAGGKRIGEGV
ncbi:hypothetical protein HAX54_006089 [Datura stramonium]|uniref:Uncharacterized protein n=1 Tax=Datura stramonium TaxID=4076 RepID=A0ABS8WVT2_DATST|nr:hypothetical protein [Datura stramonium]